MRLVFNGSISSITMDGTQKNSLLYALYRYKLTSVLVQQLHQHPSAR